MMPRLLIRSGALANQAFTLKPGVNHVGRDPANDICIGETSVSSAHCQIVVGAEGATLIDLNSTNGTFVNQSPAQNTRLQSGDAVRLGNVDCVFDGEGGAPLTGPSASAGTPHGSLAGNEARPVNVRVVASARSTIAPPPVIPVASPPAPTTGIPESAWCKNHYKSPALYYCTKCGKAFCELCVAVRHAGHVPTHNCRLCASDCVSLTGRPEAPGSRPVNFYTELPKAFAYPLNAEGLILVCVGTFFYLFLAAVGYLTRFGGLPGAGGVLVITVFGFGSLFSYLKSIITATAGGSDTMPDWPDLTEWHEDILVPFFQMIGTLLFSFLPVILVLVAVVQGHTGLAWMAIPAVILSCLYYPMGLLSVAMHDTIAGLNPLLVVVSILRVFGPYLVCCLVLGTIFLVRFLTSLLLPLIIQILIVPNVIAGLVGMYLLTVLMRIVGLLYLAHKDRLGWFNR